MTELTWRGIAVRVPDGAVADYLARGFARPKPEPEPKARAKPKGK